MEPEIAVHILDNLKELNQNVAAIAKGQEDQSQRLDKIGTWMDKEITTVKASVGALEKWQTVSSWRLGTLSAGAGAVLSFAAQWAAVKLGIKIR